MLRLQKKKLSVLFIFCSLVFISVVAFKPERKQEGYKNLQVLPKNISKDSLKMVMDGFKTALGVNCTFCHAPNKDPNVKWPDFASDEKPEKNIARHMMRMTAELNKSWFNFNNSTQPDTVRAVSCITCHRGQAHIEIDTARIRMEHQSMPPAGAAPQGTPLPPPPPGNR